LIGRSIISIIECRFKNREGKLDFNHRIQDIIRNRTSVRKYEKRPLEAVDIRKISALLSGLKQGPLNSPVRFELAASKEDDSDALRGLGTYGFIRYPAGFIVGAVQLSRPGLVDFGYLMQSILLTLTDMGLGTCWLGGSFRKSRFADYIGIRDGEIVPAVVSVGYPADKRSITDRIARFAVGSKKRMLWEELFFQSDFQSAFQPDSGNPYSRVLEMVRLAPSASNRQPWRIVFDPDQNTYHFFLQRTKSYQPHKIGLADLQIVDIGIAMCHFELAAQAFELKGNWTGDIPEINLPRSTEYIVTWKCVS